MPGGDFSRARLLLVRLPVDVPARRTRRSPTYLAAFILLATAGRSQAEGLAVGAGVGVSVAADGKNQGYGLGLLVLGEQGLIRRGALVAQAYGGALWTSTSADSCDRVAAVRCELSARVAFSGLKARLSVISRFVDLGVGVGSGTIITRGGGSRAAELRGAQLHALFGFGVELLERFALSATYLYFPSANHLTGGVSLSYRFRTPLRPAAGRSPSNTAADQAPGSSRQNGSLKRATKELLPATTLGMPPASVKLAG